MAGLKGTKTEKNILAAFAGESPEMRKNMQNVFSSFWKAGKLKLRRLFLQG